MSEYFTVQELVTKWRGVISKGTLANWRVAKKGPAFVKIGGRILYPVEGVAQWEAKNHSAANDNGKQDSAA